MKKIKQWKRYKVAERIMIALFLIGAIASILIKAFQYETETAGMIFVVTAILSLAFAFLSGIFYELKKKKMNEVIKNGQEVIMTRSGEEIPFNMEEASDVIYIIVQKEEKQYVLALISRNKDTINIKSVPKKCLKS